MITGPHLSQLQRIMACNKKRFLLLNALLFAVTTPTSQLPSVMAPFIFPRQEGLWHREIYTKIGSIAIKSFRSCNTGRDSSRVRLQQFGPRSALPPKRDWLFVWPIRIGCAAFTRQRVEYGLAGSHSNSENRMYKCNYFMAIPTNLWKAIRFAQQTVGSIVRQKYLPVVKPLLSPQDDNVVR